MNLELDKLENICATYVAWLRSLYLIHQNHHWLSRGSNFYGNHLLFERIYGTAQEHADLAAEKIIGVFGDEFFQIKMQPKLICEIVENFSTDNLLEDSLNAEEMFLQLSKLFYGELESKKAMTLGLDDMIMSIASERESSVYLLKRSLESGENMNKLSQLARKFEIKLAQVANKSAPTLTDPNAGPKNGLEAQERLDNTHLQEVGEEVKGDLAEALGLGVLASNLRFSELRLVNDPTTNKRSISWKMVIGNAAVKQYQTGVEAMRKSNPTFSVARYVTQLFNQKMPGVNVMPAQPITIG